MYQTRCPACNEDDCLYVIGGVFQATGMQLYSDGFAFADAQQMSTEDEAVRCTSCTRMFSLSELNQPEPPSQEKKFKVKGD